MNIQTLGLAYRAKKIILGTDYVVEGIRKGFVKLVFLASDASENTKKKISDKTKTYQVSCNDTLDSLTLSQLIGKRNVKVLGVTDEGFSNALK